MKLQFIKILGINQKVLRLLICLCIFCFPALFFLIGCGGGDEVKSKEQSVIPVKAAEVKVRDINKTLDYAGDIKAQDEAIIYPKINGKIIEKLKEDGNSIQKGDVIAYVDRDEVGFQFEKAPVESYLAGIVGRVYVDKGTSVTTQTPIALIVDINNVKVKLDIPEIYLSRVSVGQSAEISVDACPQDKFTGKVSKISPVLDLDTRTAPIEIIISNLDHRLKPGMFARVKLIIEEHKNVPVILKEAILGNEPNLYVYIANGKNAFQRNVKLGIHQGAYFEVVSGLKGGELVVIMGQQRLYDNALISVESEEGITK